VDVFCNLQSLYLHIIAYNARESTVFSWMQIHQIKKPRRDVSC